MENVHCWMSKSVTMPTEKYATTMKAAWNVKFVGFDDQTISNTRENGG
jgi:hypothetical protein